MSTRRSIGTLLLRCVTGTIATLLLCHSAVLADDKKPVAVTKPAVKATSPAKAVPPAKPGAQVPGRPGAQGASGKPPVTTGNRVTTTTESRREPTTTNTQRPTTTTPTRPTVSPTRPTATINRPAPGPDGHVKPAGMQTTRMPNGNEVSKRANNQVADVKVPNRNMTIHHELAGGRRVAVENRDGSRIVAERGGPSYVQHPYQFRNQEFGRRTYYDHGRVYDAYYRRYPYRGVYVERYAPAYYYAPGFYGWAYNPWPTPISYAWGWGANPWYGYYGYYFTPYPAYAGASFWLTDYMLSQSLAASYQERQEQSQAMAAPTDSVALTPEVKNLVTEEVKRQVSLENNESSTRHRARTFRPIRAGLGAP